MSCPRRRPPRPLPFRPKPRSCTTAHSGCCKKATSPLPGCSCLIWPSGAKAMLAAGTFDGSLGTPKPDAVFGLHVGITPAEAGTLTYRPNGFMAGADFFRVVVRGRQTHGAAPWAGVDPVVAASSV